MSETPTTKFGYRRLSTCAWREANRRAFALLEVIWRQNKEENMRGLTERWMRKEKIAQTKGEIAALDKRCGNG